MRKTMMSVLIFFHVYNIRMLHNSLNRLFIVSIITLITSKIFFQYHIINIDDVIFRFQFLLDGMPDWKTYQNRLLGPYIVYLINKLINNYENSYIVFLLFFILINNILFEISLNNKVDHFKKIYFLILYNFFFFFTNTILFIHGI